MRDIRENYVPIGGGSTQGKRPPWSAPKRVLDIGVALMVLLLTSPILVAAAIAIRLTSPGPILHRSKRVGRGGRIMTIYKLRTMIAAVNGSGPRLTLANDGRITRIGRTLRKTKIDEVPQFLNVLLGQMSVVGPRPEDPHYVQSYTSQERRVLTARPGVTSPASIVFWSEESGREESDAENDYRERILPEKLDLDLRYVDEQSLWLDVKIILRTARLVGQLIASDVGRRLLCQIPWVVKPSGQSGNRPANRSAHTAQPDTRSGTERKRRGA